MRLLAASNSFKGSLSSSFLNKLIKKELTKYLPELEIKDIAVSDGGDGFLDCFIHSNQGELKFKKLTGPLKNKKVYARYLLSGDSAYIEIAEICGIKYLSKNELSPLYATSYGVGEIIAYLIKKGVKEFFIGLGGAASNDGGFGMARTLGFDFLDADGDKIENSILGLLDLFEIRKSKINLEKIKFYGITDVNNLLLGKHGSARVFARQKGASKKEIEIIEKALKKLSQVVNKSLGIEIRKIKGGAAAGGLGAGLRAFLNARLLNGSQFISEKLKLESEIKKSDIILTGEGVLDKSTLYGKIPHLILSKAKKYNKRTIFICADNKIVDKRIDLLISLEKHFSREFCMRNPEEALKKNIKLIYPDIRRLYGRK